MIPLFVQAFCHHDIVISSYGLESRFQKLFVSSYSEIYYIEQYSRPSLNCFPSQSEALSKAYGYHVSMKQT